MLLITLIILKMSPFFCSDDSRRRTKTLQKSLNPKWNETFLYGPLKRQDLVGRTLEITVWDFENHGAKEFLGEVGAKVFLGEVGTTDTSLIFMN